MSVFDILKNNQGSDDVGVYMAYSTYEDYLRKAQDEKLDEIISLIEGLDNWGAIDTAFVPELIEIIEERYNAKRQTEEESHPPIRFRDIAQGE